MKINSLIILILAWDHGPVNHTPLQSLSLKHDLVSSGLEDWSHELSLSIPKEQYTFLDWVPVPHVSEH